MKEHYDYQLDLLEIMRTNPEMRRKLVKNMGYREPGIFHDVKGGILRKIVYF